MKKVEVKSQQLIFDDFFKIQEAHLSFEQYDSRMSPLVRRLSFERGDSVAALVHHTEKQQFIFIEQFRYPSYTRGEGWIMELVAGGLAQTEDPQAAIIREIEEEIGYCVNEVEKVGEFYPSPGGSSEKIFLYYAKVNESQKTSEGGGLLQENEDIKKVFLNIEESLFNLQMLRFVDAKIIIALQWFFLKFTNTNQIL